MIIKGQADIEIQISEQGYICIKQYDDDGGEQVVQFAPAYAPKLANAIIELQDFAQKKFEKYQPEEV
jgi:hypothetical protein